MTEPGAATENRREAQYEAILEPFTLPAVTHRLAGAPLRQRVVVEGTVGSVSRVGWVGGPVTEVSLVDQTDMVTLVFFGGRGIGGLEPGRRLVAAGTLGIRDGRRVILSPQLWLVPVPASDELGVGGVETLIPAPFATS